MEIVVAELAGSGTSASKLDRQDRKGEEHVSPRGSWQLLVPFSIFMDMIQDRIIEFLTFPLGLKV